MTTAADGRSVWRSVSIIIKKLKRDREQESCFCSVGYVRRYHRGTSTETPRDFRKSSRPRIQSVGTLKISEEVRTLEEENRDLKAELEMLRGNPRNRRKTHEMPGLHTFHAALHKRWIHICKNQQRALHCGKIKDR